jgi:hypothetical protein
MKQSLRAGLLAFAAFLASPLPGQVVIQQLGPFQNPLLLVEIKEAQTDLKLTEEQVKKIAELSRKHAEGLKGLGFQDLEKRKKVEDTTRKELGEILTAEQGKRLQQLHMQQRGVSAFLDPAIVKELELTKEQQATIAKIPPALGPKWIAILQASRGNQAEMQKKVDELNRATVADILKNLTFEQQGKWAEMSGTAFAGVLPPAPFVGIVINPRPQPALTWHMNDLAAAQAEARKTGKPIFVTFRCEA